MATSAKQRKYSTLPDFSHRVFTGLTRLYISICYEYLFAEREAHLFVELEAHLFVEREAHLFTEHRVHTKPLEDRLSGTAPLVVTSLQLGGIESRKLAWTSPHYMQLCHRQRDSSGSVSASNIRSKLREVCKPRSPCMVTWTSHGLICQLIMYLSLDLGHFCGTHLNTHILSVLSPDYYPHPAYSYEPGIVRFIHTLTTSYLPLRH